MIKMVVGIVGMSAVLATGSIAVAGKTYQVTGTVVEVSAKSVTVEKDNEKWQINLPGKLKTEGGKLEVGKKVTIHYEMTAKSAKIAEGAAAAEKAPSGNKTVGAIEKTGNVAGKVLDVPAKAVGNVAPTAGKVLAVPGQAVQQTGQVTGAVVGKTANTAGKVVQDPVGAAGSVVRKTGEAVTNTADKVLGETPAPAKK